MKLEKKIKNALVKTGLMLGLASAVPANAADIDKNLEFGFFQNHPYTSNIQNSQLLRMDGSIDTPVAKLSAKFDTSMLNYITKNVYSEINAKVPSNKSISGEIEYVDGQFRKGDKKDAFQRIGANYNIGNENYDVSFRGMYYLDGSGTSFRLNGKLKFLEDKGYFRVLLDYEPCNKDNLWTEVELNIPLSGLKNNLPKSLEKLGISLMYQANTPEDMKKGEKILVGAKYKF